MNDGGGARSLFYRSGSRSGAVGYHCGECRVSKQRVCGWYLPGSGGNHDVVIIVNFDDNPED